MSLIQAFEIRKFSRLLNSIGNEKQWDHFPYRENIYITFIKSVNKPKGKKKTLDVDAEISCKIQISWKGNLLEELNYNSASRYPKFNTIGKFPSIGFKVQLKEELDQTDSFSRFQINFATKAEFKKTVEYLKSIKIDVKEEIESVPNNARRGSIGANSSWNGNSTNLAQPLNPFFSQSQDLFSQTTYPNTYQYQSFCYPTSQTFDIPTSFPGYPDSQLLSNLSQASSQTLVARDESQISESWFKKTTQSKPTSKRKSISKITGTTTQGIKKPPIDFNLMGDGDLKKLLLEKLDDPDLVKKVSPL